ncbi:MAG TPA: ThiF family adenylyltransferase [Candidatus Binataceae bacterium]|nr:ThiF family adenylyltransferase [Candidatus Binataceae bacterium]
MILNDQQIERYSRQIIVPGVGGRAQERLLGAHAAVVAEPADAEGALAYLAGAGVGRITSYPLGAREAYEQRVAHLRDLNPEVTVMLAGGAEGARRDADALTFPGLILALIGSARTAEIAESVCRAHRHAQAVIARLDTPALVAVLPAPPPCALCADAEVLRAPGERAANAGAVGMVAVTEAFKLLAGLEERPAPRLFEFTGYATTPRALARRAGGARCACQAQ